ncbi:MAG: TIGR03808 family TAT-translocated repetitive protein [Rhizobiales bacterium]|nr:TIGR03808 family TAT-translocated repetitive protein [Hyphomicrobiales bacterium]
MRDDLTRRRFLAGAAGTTALLTTASSSAFPLTARPHAAPHYSINTPGSGRLINAAEKGVVPGLSDDQSVGFQRLLDLSAEQDVPVFLPGGVYKVGGITLPLRARLVGVAGSTRLTFTGRGFIARAERADLIHIDGIIFDGLGLPLAEQGQGLLTLNTVRDLRLSNSDFIASGLHGVDLTGVGGSVRGCYFSNIADTAIFSKQSQGLSVVDNRIEDCGNGGILIHRFTPGDDGSVVISNRIERVKSVNGGTGQWGNGINVYQAHNVMVANNRIASCALSSVRINAGQNVIVSANHCTGSGETAIYGEFAFQGMTVANNVIDGGTIGVSLANFNEGGRLASVSGNIIRNLSSKLPYDNPGAFRPGIGIYAEADTVISANVIENVPNTGIHVGWGGFCRNVIVGQNLVRSAPYGIAVSVDKDARSVVVTDNVFSDIAQSAIAGFDHEKPATGELLGGKASPFDHLTLSGNRLT